MPNQSIPTATGSQRPRRHTLTAIALALALFPTLASAECATAEGNQWISGRQYDQGALVYDDGQWYQARERQAGHEPGSGFSWKTVTEPDCGADKAARDPADSVQLETPLEAAAKPGEPTTVTTKNACPEIAEFSFGESYSPGALVSHQGQIYRAMRPSTGTMPGFGMPPHWEQHDSACEEN